MNLRLPISSVHMHLEINRRDDEGVVVLTFKGRLILGADDSLARQNILQLIQEGKTKLVLNLKEVSDIDTSGLGTLVYCATEARERGGRLVIVNLSKSHAKLSDTFRLNTTFEIYEDEVDAVNSFFPDRKIPRYDILTFVEEQTQKTH